MAITYHAGRRTQGIAGIDVAGSFTSSTDAHSAALSLGGGSGSGNTKVGFEVQTGHFLVNKGLKTLTFALDRYNAVSGNGYVAVYNSSGTQKGSNSSTYNLANLTQYPSPVDYTFTWTTPIIIDNGDRIVLEGGTFSTSNQVDLWSRNVNASEQYVNGVYFNSGWTSLSGTDVHFDVTTATNNGDTKPTNVQLGSRLEETDTRKMYNYSDVSTSELKAYYKFDESSGNIINQATSVGSSDSLGSNADMTISGATYSQTGKIGSALSFDGSNDYGTLGSSLSQWNFFHGTGDWSINFWINYDEFVAEDRFFSNMDSTETRGINFGVGWSGNPDGQIGLSIKSDNGFMTNNGGINFPSDISGTGTWVMITLVADYSDTTNTYTVYLNGVAGSSVARAVAGSTGDSEYSLKLASRGNYADRFFDGLFDEMTIWQRVLTADEITSLYNSNSGRAISSGIFKQWQEIGA